MTKIISQGDWWFSAGLVAPKLGPYAAEFNLDWDTQKFDTALAARDHQRMHSMLQALWESLPDDPSIRHAPFFDMCDLITEEWVFHDIATEDPDETED